MRLSPLALALVLVVSACKRGGPVEATVTEKPYTYADLPCEPGTSLAGRAPPEGFKVWCRKQLPNGQWLDQGGMIEFFPNGQRSVLGHHVDGRKEGLWITYYETGEQESEETFVNNRAEGASLSWWPNGQIKGEGVKLNGKEDGEWKYFHANGVLFKSGLWVDGNPDGVWIEYDESGKAVRERVYKFGRMLSHRELTP